MPQSYPMSDVRVVELSQFVGGAYCAKIFAELGADVLAVEPPGGHPLRRRPIQPGGSSDSLFRYLFTNKRVATADLDSAEDRRRLQAAVEQADILVTDYGVDELDRVLQGAGGIDGLSERVLVVRVKPYVGRGHERRGPSTYFTAYQSGGEAYLIPGGEQYLSRPPAKVVQYGGEYDAGLYAAIGGIAALYARRRGVVSGDLLEVSVQASSAQMVRMSVGRHIVDGRIDSRAHRGPRPGTTLRCADGFVEIAGADDRLFEVMGRPEWTKRPEVQTMDWRRTNIPEFNELIESWTSEHSKHEVRDLGQKAHIPIGSVDSPSDVLASEQHKYRGFFHAGSSGSIYPGLPFTIASGALPPVDDYKAGDLSRPFEPVPVRGGAPQSSNGSAPAGSRPLPLEGVRVVEFSWYLAVPFAGLLLASLGADVIKIESTSRMDNMRIMEPIVPVDPEHPHESSIMYHDANLGKKSITLDMSAPGAADIALELVKHADIVLQNYSVGVLARLGAGYDKMREVNPNVIIVSETTCGEEGPWSHYVGFGMVFSALSGMGGGTGYPDARPCDVRDGADVRIATTVALPALAMLLRRQAQGRGGELASVSGVESLSRYLGEALVERAAGGFEYNRNGNEDPVFCPNNGYPCAGTDNWVAISIRDDDDWKGLRKVTGKAELDDPRFAHVEGRRRHEAEIDRIIGAWTQGHDAQEAAEALRKGGVPASAVYNAKMMFEDEELKAAGFLPVVEHKYFGRRAAVGVPWEYKRLRAEVRGAAPLLGEHNEYVFEQVLGMDKAKVAGLQERGIIR